MAVHRPVPACPNCGEPIRGIYKDESHLPFYKQTIGDTFIRWDWEGHKCQEEKDRGCPCLYLKQPCHDKCTCVNSLSSSGCYNCCTYGSLEQQIINAEKLNIYRLHYLTNVMK